MNYRVIVYCELYGEDRDVYEHVDCSGCVDCPHEGWVDAMDYHCSFDLSTHNDGGIDG